ncbi:MAG: DNA-deoxyinosine glycosylase [Oscillospiraceae bacterium]|nr:DNA-deoxyinosine glycosylase [Oscillospiraceae bacterium]
MITHPIEPVYDKASRILILGSFPSVMSREAGFFYGHPQNRFWKVVSAIFEEDIPQTVEEKKAFLLRNHIALWDVVASCDIEGSADATIRNVEPNDINKILTQADIHAIYVNGKTAFQFYTKYSRPVTNRPAVCLPSTSPANASWNLELLTEAWQCIKEVALSEED